MENDAGEFVDLYCPRKCSASNRIIHAKDHASVQIAIPDVDPETGRITDKCKTYAICGSIRRMGESDDCITRLSKHDKILPHQGSDDDHLDGRNNCKRKKVELISGCSGKIGTAKRRLFKVFIFWSFLISYCTLNK